MTTQTTEVEGAIFTNLARTVRSIVGRKVDINRKTILNKYEYKRFDIPTLSPDHSAGLAQLLSCFHEERGESNYRTREECLLSVCSLRSSYKWSPKPLPIGNDRQNLVYLVCEKVHNFVAPKNYCKEK